MSKTILLADDSVTIQKVVGLTFMDQDYQVVAVSDGSSALAKLSELKPDLLIADVHMPGANGYEVCRRSKETYSDVPVLLLVGTFEQFDDGEAAAVGADSHLKKPFDSQDLLYQVESLISRASAAAASSPPAESPPAAEPITEVSSLEPPSLMEEAPASFDAPPASASAVATPFPFASGVPAAGEPDEDEEDTVVSRFVLEPEAPETDEATAVEPDALETVVPGASPSEAPLPAGATDLGVTDFGAALEPAGQPAEAPPISDFAGPAAGEPAVTSEPGIPTFDAPTPEASPPEEAAAEEAGAGEDAAAEKPAAAAAEEPAAAAAEGPVAAAAEEPAPAAAEEPAPAAAEEAAAAVAEEPAAAPAAASTNGDLSLSDDDVDRIARRVIDLAGDKALREVAWDVVPDLAEVIIKERIRELESEVE